MQYLLNFPHMGIILNSVIQTIARKGKIGNNPQNTQKWGNISWTEECQKRKKPYRRLILPC